LVNLLDIPSQNVVLLLHGYGKLLLVIVEERGVGHDDEWNLVAEGFQDGARAYDNLSLDGV
jgi:hypothetical protein